MRQVEPPRRIETFEQLLVDVVAAHAAEAHEVECWIDGELEAIVGTDTLRERLRQRDVLSNVMPQPFDAVVADNEPKLQRAKPASKRDLPVAIIEDRARSSRSRSW